MMVYGPGRHWRVFRVRYDPGEAVGLDEMDEAVLTFSSLDG
jgi:hypothetical protein